MRKTLRKFTRKLWDNEEGQGLAEFAMLLPMILLTLGLLISGSQMIFSVGAGYYADYMAARLAMVPGASIPDAERAGQQLLDDSPFVAVDKLQTTCIKDNYNTTCSTSGVDKLIFPVIGIGGNVAPTTTYDVHVSLTLPTQNPN